MFKALRFPTKISLADADSHRILSINYGRSPMLEAGLDVRQLAPSPFEDEIVNSQGAGSGDDPVSLVAGWEQSMKLLEILTVLQIRMNAPQPQSPLRALLHQSPCQVSLQAKVNSGDLSDILAFDRLLRQWRSEVPAFLRVQEQSRPPTAVQDTPIQRQIVQQKVILHMRSVSYCSIIHHLSC